MSKRKADNDKKITKKSEMKTNIHNEGKEDQNDIEYEDLFEDEYEEEDVIEASDDDSDNYDANKEMEKLNSKMNKLDIWDPKKDPLKAGEVLDFDDSAYIMYYTYETEWPCLSFDIIIDNLGYNRTEFPKSSIIVAGSQSSQPKEDRIYVVKMSHMHQTNLDEEELNEDDDDDTDTSFIPHEIRHPSGVNRIRSLPSCPQYISTFCDNNKVYIWDASNVLHSVDNINHDIVKMDPIYTFEGHKSEGFALSWNPLNNNLLSGDTSGNIYLHTPTESKYAVNGTTFVGHRQSVEDINWSPNEPQVFASCSVDKHIRIWDCRNHGKSMLDCLAHESDINVISWNKLDTTLFLTGCDDGSFKVWDLRKLAPSNQLANYTWFSDPITSVEWSPVEKSVLAVSADDGQLTVWDLSLEKDDTDKGNDIDIPTQLTFVHRGQTLTKELHFHPQLPGVIASTAQDGFNIFQPDVEIIDDCEIEQA